MTENVETDTKNLQQFPEQFLPTFGLFRAMSFLEAKLLKFQRFICHIKGFFILLGSRDIRKML